MNHPKIQPIFAEDAEIDETNVLAPQHPTQVTKSTNIENRCKEEIISAGGKQKRRGECFSWVYSIVVAIFFVFFLVQAVSLITVAMQKRQMFSKNLQILKQTHSLQENTIEAKPTLPQEQNLINITQNILKNPPVRERINLKINQAKVQLRQQEKPTHKNNGQARYMIPQNNYAPFVPIGETIIRQKIQIINTEAQNRNYQNENLQTDQFTPFLTFDTQNQFQSLGQPESESSVKVFPTISPFNDVSDDPSTNEFSFQGQYASITTSQITFARQLRQIINAQPQRTERLALKQKNFYEKKYSISKYQELPFCIVVPTYNNADRQRYLNNIKSILMQEYSNFHIVIIDDNSNDGTGGLISDYLISQPNFPSERYKIIRNTEQRRAMPNLRTAAKEYCKPQQIFLIVDGDDELLGRQVLKLFNAVFQQKKLWFVYSNFLSTSGGVGYSRAFPRTIIEKNSYRAYPFVTSHLRAFYTRLFINVKEQDLKDESGEYLKAANDVAICIPILQQAHQRVGYLPELTYFYNSNTGMNNHILRLNEQRTNDAMIRKREPYKRLENLID